MTRFMQNYTEGFEPASEVEAGVESIRGTPDTKLMYPSSLNLVWNYIPRILVAHIVYIYLSYEILLPC